MIHGIPEGRLPIGILFTRLGTQHARSRNSSICRCPNGLSRNRCPDRSTVATNSQFAESLS